MKTALWIIAFAQMYNIVEAWFWGLHWRVKGKKEFENNIKSRDLEKLMKLYDTSECRCNNGE